MIKLDYIREYLTLVETLNFSKTAELMYITQPSLSRHVAELEEEMGAKLLIRSTRSVVLTPAGEEVYRCFKNIEKEFRQLKEQTERMSKGTDGSLVIYCPYYWMERYLEPVLTVFRDKNPNCRLEIISCQPPEAFHALQNKQADLTLNYETSNIDPDVRRVAFAKEKIAVFMSADHPLADKFEITMKDLEGFDQYAVESRKNYPIKISFDNNSTDFSNLLLTGNMIYSQQIDTLPLDLKRSKGISLLPYEVRKIGRDYIKAALLTDGNPETSMCLYYRAENANQLIPAFVKTALDCFIR